MKLVKGAQTVIRYDPLWKTMAKKKATTYTLRVTFGMSHATVQRLQLKCYTNVVTVVANKI